MRNKANSQNRFMRLITLPIRALGRARDLYVRSMTEYAEKVSYGGNLVGVPTGQGPYSLPKSFKVSSSSSRSNDSVDIRELIRAASARSLGNGAVESAVDRRIYVQQQVVKREEAGAGVPRSCSVGMGRIDEDRPCDFGEYGGADGGNVVRADLVYPMRSRSYAVNKRSVVF